MTDLDAKGLEAVDLVAPLMALAKAGIPTDIQELLVQGNPMRGIAPGALAAALSAVLPPCDGVGVKEWRCFHRANK